MISVIVPIFKVERYLDRCVSSILNQTYKDIEVILLDDGSPDSCPHLCDIWAQRDSRVKVIHQGNQGLSAPRNAGIEISSGEWLAFVDGDDYISLEFCSKLLNAVQSNNSEIAICEFYWAYEDPVYRLLKNQTNIQSSIKKFNGNELIEFYFTNPPEALWVVWGKLFKRSLFFNDFRLRFPLNALHEDNFITYKLLYLANQIVFINTPLYYYVQRSDSIMGKYNRENIEWLLKSIEDYLSWYKVFAPELRNIMEYAAFNRYVGLVKKCTVTDLLHGSIPDLLKFWTEIKSKQPDLIYNPYMNWKSYIKYALLECSLLDKAFILLDYFHKKL